MKKQQNFSTRDYYQPLMKQPSFSLLRQGSSFSSCHDDPLTLRSVSIEIRNHHDNLELLRPSYFLESGTVHAKPVPVSAGMVERCSFTKSPAALKGTEGLLCYEIHKHTKINTILPSIHGQSIIPPPEKSSRNESFARLYVMWSAPIFYPYRHAIGISGMEGNISMQHIFDRMYYDFVDGKLFIRRRALNKAVFEKTIYGITVTIEASMSDDNNAELVVEIK